MNNVSTVEPRSVLAKIIARGGLIGYCAALYIDNDILTIEFLADCAQQCLQSNIGKFWGEELSREILLFTDPTRDNTPKAFIDRDRF